MINNVIIVLNYNDFETTVNFIKSINNYTSFDKIIVVDNASTDDSFSVLKKYKTSKIDVIVTDRNGGYAYGNNYGVRYAIEKYSPKYITISNPDVFIENNSINSIIEVLDSNKSVALATGIMVDENNKISKDFAWKIPNFYDDIRACFLFISKFRNKIRYNLDSIKNCDILDVEVVPGSFFIIKRSIFEKVNFFDEDTFLFCEERILAIKLKKNNYKSVILTTEKFIHYHSKTINKNIVNHIKKYDLLKESKIIYMRKYLAISELKIKIYNIIHEISKVEKYLLNFYINKLKK